MGITASIVSAVLKSGVGDKLGSGLAKDLIGISIDGISEKGINEITDFINRGKSKIDSILSKENMKSMGIPEDNIDYVVAEIKDLLSKISITDEVLRQCKYNNMILKDFLWNEYRENKNDYIECESEIKRCLFAVEEALIKIVRESENFEKDVLIHISNSVDAIRSEEQISSQIMVKRFDRLEESNQEILNRISVDSDLQSKNIEQKKVKSRTQEYADIWNKNMFLNDFDKWDENAGVNVKLSDVYIDEHLPHFIWGENKKEDEDLDALLSRYLLENDMNKMLLILGQSGIGKSTLITWIVTKYNMYAENILVFKFAEELKNISWGNSNISKEILDFLNLSYNDLNGKTLILDGFDEVNIGDNRKEILDNLYEDWIYKKNIKKFSLIITCRENYISKFDKIKCQYITLQPWDEKQIRSFCNIFSYKTIGDISESTIEKLLENKEILGIPLILYMILALNISIEKEGSIVDVYDKIFSLEGGIYDRCIDNKNFADKHRIVEIKEQIHQISREIAIWMFENNSEKASISQKEYEKICDNLMEKHERDGKSIKEDAKIGNFFKSVKHCEGVGTDELYFAHRTIYEYFVVETIYNSIESSMMELSDESQEKLAGNIAPYLKQGEIDYTIGEYLRHKFLKLYNKLGSAKQELFYCWWEKAIEKMMKMGMFYYMKKSANYVNIFARETQCFNNLIEVLRLIIHANKKQYILEDADQFLLMRYIKHSLIECRILYIGNMEIDNTEQVWGDMC